MQGEQEEDQDEKEEMEPEEDIPDSACTAMSEAGLPAPTTAKLLA